MTPYLTDTEIADICDPLVLPAAQTRHLRALGLLVKHKPNGKPLVARSEFERVMCQSKTANDAQGPNVIALNEALRKRQA